MLHTPQPSRIGGKCSLEPGLCVGAPINAFTLIVLLVVIAIIASLAALVLPTSSRTKASVLSAVCKSNLRQLGVGLNLYVDDYKKYPGGPTSIATSSTATWLASPSTVVTRGLPELATFVRGGEAWTESVNLSLDRNT